MINALFRLLVWLFGVTLLLLLAVVVFFPTAEKLSQVISDKTGVDVTVSAVKLSVSRDGLGLVGQFVDVNGTAQYRAQAQYLRAYLTWNNIFNGKFFDFMISGYGIQNLARPLGVEEFLMELSLQDDGGITIRPKRLVLLIDSQRVPFRDLEGEVIVDKDRLIRSDLSFALFGNPHDLTVEHKDREMILQLNGKLLGENAELLLTDFQQTVAAHSYRLDVRVPDSKAKRTHIHLSLGGGNPVALFNTSVHKMDKHVELHKGHWSVPKTDLRVASIQGSHRATVNSQSFVKIENIRHGDREIEYLEIDVTEVSPFVYQIDTFILRGNGGEIRNDPSKKMSLRVKPGDLSLQGRFLVEDIGDVLRDVRVTDYKNDGDGEIDIDIKGTKWDLHSFNGTAKVDFEDGSIVNLDAKIMAIIQVGKLLNVLNPDSILSGDLFKRGLTYRTLTGDIIVKRGVVMVKRLEFRGPEADIDVHGNIDLPKASYRKLHVKIDPKVETITTSIINRLTGGLVDWFEEEIDPALRPSYYEVSGPFSKPIISPIPSE